MERVGARWPWLAGAIALAVWGGATLGAEAPTIDVRTVEAPPLAAAPVEPVAPLPDPLGGPLVPAPPGPASGVAGASMAESPLVATPATTLAPLPTPMPPPDTLVPLESGPPSTPDRLGASALELLHYDWQAQFDDWSIDFLGPRPGLRALTYPRERRIEVFVRPEDTPDSVHRVLAHEIGHMIDVELNSNDDRDRWRAQRGLGEGVSWWPSASDPDFATGAGDFAEAFAVWETGVISQSTVGSQPDGDDLALLEELVADR